MKGKYDNINQHIGLGTFTSKENGNISNIHLGVIKYKLWKKGKIDWTSEDIKDGFGLDTPTFKCT